MSGRRGRRIRKSLQRAAIIRLPPAKNEHPTMFSCFDIRIARILALYGRHQSK
ncbi:hypothetical protein ASZ90_012170 [hydrocarbon metagenome]|uniref:Uncharacterized protein n=1 Tax=hydrocarbon metagenome TaxID=938273 RepID=A0A0W8FB61_9ZZZZ